MKRRHRHLFHDSEQRFPESVVKYQKFKSPHVNYMFSYLREKEDVYKRDLIMAKNTDYERIIKARLYEVEAQLIWMSHNILEDGTETSRYFDE